MKVSRQPAEDSTAEEEGLAASDHLSLLTRAVSSNTITGLVIGLLIGIKDDGRTPLVTHPGMITAVTPARSVVDLHSGQIGKPVALMFEGGELSRPIVIGVLRGADTSPAANDPGGVEVNADGERLVVTAKDQLVLRCGKASITLTRAGKVLIEGALRLDAGIGCQPREGRRCAD